MASVSRFNRRLGLLLIGVPGLMIASVFVLWLVATWFASAKIEAVQARWDRKVGGLEQVLERYPSRPENDAALQIERLAAELGIPLGPNYLREKRNLPDKAARRAYGAARKGIGDHLFRHVKRNKRKLTAPDAAAAGWFAANRATLDRMRSALVDGASPAWERDLSRMFAAPIPNLLGQVNLQKALLAEALAHAAAGDRALAFEGLEASWNLNRTLVTEPELIEQLVGLSIARLQAGVLRQLEEVPPRWRERLATESYRQGVLDAMYLQGWVNASFSDPRQHVDQGPQWEQKLRRFTAPYYAYSSAMAGERYLQGIDKLAESEAGCDGALADQGISIDLDLPDWAANGAIFAPQIHGFDRLRRLEFDLELTRMVVERGERPVRATVESTVCPGEQWSFAPQSDGGLVIAFSREVEWPDNQAGPMLPSEFRLPPRRSAVTRLD